jgi:hypothetical protein
MQNDEGLTSLTIHNFVYCSRALHDMDKEALDQIIATPKLE